MKNNLIKISTFASLVLLVLACFTFVYFYREINKNNEESQIAETKWHIEELRRQELKTLNDSINEIQEERAELETHFARSSDIVPFLNTIEELASEVNAVAEVLSVNIEADNVSLMVTLEATGTFDGIYQFLRLLENSPYELEFVSAGIEGGKTLNESEEVTSSSWNGFFRVKLLSFINEQQP